MGPEGKLYIPCPDTGLIRAELKVIKDVDFGPSNANNKQTDAARQICKEKLSKRRLAFLV